MCGRLDSYLISFSHLPSARDKSVWSLQSYHRSPLVPLFLLSIIDQIHTDAILRNFVSPNAELQSVYSGYLQLLSVPESNAPIFIPFTALKKAAFWELVKRPDISSPMKKYDIPRCDEDFRKLYLGGRFSEDLYTLLQMAHLRRKMRTTLIETYFRPPLKDQLENLSNLNWKERKDQQS